jgi:hypothetical protein
MQNLAPKRVYRPVLLERPSMTKFVVLSVLMHIWAVVLFGDASEGASRGTSGGWASTFTAKLGQAVQSQAASSNIPSANKPVRNQATPTTLPSQATSATPVAATIAESSPPSSTPIIEPIPVIALETNNPVSDFVVPSLNIAPIAAPQSSATTNFAAIVLPPVAAPVAKSDDNFAIYVPPIIERARVEIADVPLAIAPLPTSAPPPLATKDFETFKPPPPLIPSPTSMPAAATLAPQVNPVVPPPVVTASPIVQIAPLEKIVLPPSAARDFAPAVSTSITPTLDVPKPDTTSATATRANTGSSVIDRVNVEKAATATSRGDGSSSTTVNPSANAGGADGLSSLLPIIPIIPIKPVTPTLDLDRLRQRAREVAVEGSGPRMLLPFPTVAKPAEKRDIEKIFDKALKRPDCKDEYADMGLAAVVPLVRDAIKGTGCKW